MKIKQIIKYMLIVIIGALCLLSCNSSPENEKSFLLDKFCMPVIDNFFGDIKSGKYNTALDSLLSGNENIDLKDSSAINLISQFKNINEFSGKYIECKLLKKKSVNDDIAVYSYLVKYERKFYRFIFVFYNTGKSIKIYKFKFDDTIDIDLEESLRLYI